MNKIYKKEETSLEMEIKQRERKVMIMKNYNFTKKKINEK